MEPDKLNALLALSAVAPYAAEAACRWMKRSGKVFARFLQTQSTPMPH